MTDTNQLPPLPTPQPAQAAQAELTDAGIEQVLALAHSYADAKLMRYGALGIKEPPDPAAAFVELRRAILALRPQAVQAEVTEGIRPEDFTVDVVVKPMGGFAPVNTQGVRVTHKPTGISVTCDAARSQHTNRHQAFEKLRAILALRPERVPMTPASRDVIMATRTANADADEWPEPWAYQRGWNDAEAHHGINAQAKKEAP